MRMGMGLGGSLLLAVSGLVVGETVSAVGGKAVGGRILMQVPTDTDHEYQLAIGDVSTGEVIPVGKPALDRLPGDLSGPFWAVGFEGTLVVSGLEPNPVVLGPDGSVSEFVVAGGIRGMPNNLDDGEHYFIAGGILTTSTGEFRPLESFSADFGDRDIYLDNPAGDWLEIGNENATVYVQLSDLDTVRTLPESASHSAVWLRADGQAVWEEDREGSSALMIADLSTPGPAEVSAREFYSAEPFVNMRSHIGDLVVAGRTELLLIDPLTGETVRNVSADFALPPRSEVYGGLGDTPWLQVYPSGGDAELINLETDQRVAIGNGSVVASTTEFVLWEGDEGLLRVFDLSTGSVGDIEMGDLSEYLWAPAVVGELVVFPGCYAPVSVLVDPAHVQAVAMSPICEAVATTDGRFVVGGLSLPDDRLESCATPMLVEELGVGVVQGFPSGCPLAWLVEP